MARNTEILRREEHGLARPASASTSNPFRMMERLVDEMDRVFEDFGLGRGWGMPSPGRNWLTPVEHVEHGWHPEVEVFHRNSELVVRADLPGLSKDDVKVDVNEDRITIQGERKKQHEEEHEGVYRSERSYGSFFRQIPLPPGSMSDQAKAVFREGVLEITMPAPPESARRGRRLEISEATTGSAGTKK